MDKASFESAVATAKLVGGKALDVGITAAYYCWIPAIIIIGAYKCGLKPKDALQVVTPLL